MKEHSSLNPNQPENAPSGHGDASTSKNMPSPVRVRRRNRMITSCLECRRRKLRCDRLRPCTNCSRSTRNCVFLAPALDTVSQLRLTQIKDKMGCLEHSLGEDVKEDTSTSLPEDEKDLKPTPVAVAEVIYDDVSDEAVDLGIRLGKLRLTGRLGGFFHPKLGEELGTLTTIDDNTWNGNGDCETCSDLFAPGPTYLAPCPGTMFGISRYSDTLLNYLPSKTASDRLMQQYFFAVHHVARVVHRPSFERQYLQFWTDISIGIEPPASLQSLVLAAMLSAAVSMNEKIISVTFDVSKTQLVELLHRGTEIALAKAQFIRTTKIETLQALVMYLIPLCRGEMCRAHSAMIALTIRLAECMGLHSDPTHYGLSPLDVHVRRMLWAQICFLDLRAAESQGPRPAIRSEDFDTQFPLNVDDDEFVDSADPEERSDRWTDMTFSLIRFECMAMYRIIWVDRPRIDKKQTSLTSVITKIENFRKSMYKKYNYVLDSQDPLIRDARLVMDLLIERLITMVLHRYYNPSYSRLPERFCQTIIESCVLQLEKVLILETDPDLEPWSWYTGAYQQYQVAILLLYVTSVIPCEQLDRIWKCLDYVFETSTSMPRDEKVEYISKEINTRLQIYYSKHKIRPPTNMLREYENLQNERKTDTVDVLMNIDWDEWDRLFPTMPT